MNTVFTTHQASRPATAAINAALAGGENVERVAKSHRQNRFDLASTFELATVEEVGASVATSISSEMTCRALVAVYEPIRNRFRLIGDSAGIEKSRRLTAGDPIEQVLTESRIIGCSADGRCLDSTAELTTSLRSELAHRCGVDWARVVLVSDAANHLQAAVVLTPGPGTPDAPWRRLGIGASTKELASYLRIRREADATGYERIRRVLAGRIATNRAKLGLAAIALVIGLLAAPAPHHVGADCQCEPTTRRIVTAPFDARLEDCLVKPGDTVVRGQVLARFDAKELASEIEERSAERRRYQQRHDAAVAAGDTSKAAEAALQVHRLESRLTLLELKQQRLALRSPISGVVVSGDLEESVGASLAIGQQLLEIAPLDTLIAEIAIPESEIGLIEERQRVTLRFDGAGGNHTASIERLFPRAEVIDGANVYIAEGEIEGDTAELAPGMRGRASVHGEWRSLGSIIFRKPWLVVRRFWGWY